MTVTTPTFQISYTASGTSGEQFTVPYPFFDDGELKVTMAGALQTISSNYTVSGGSGATGTITWVGEPTAAATIIITRIVPNTQKLEYGDSGAFPAASHEQGLDRAAMTAQQSIQRDTTDGQNYTAQSKQIKDLATGTDGTDAVNLTQLQAQTFLASGGVPTPANPGDDGKYLRAAAGSYALTTFPGEQYNFIMNPHGELIQRAGQGSIFTAAGTVFVNDDAEYAWDRWVLLSDGDDIVDCSADTSVRPEGAPASMKFNVQTTVKKFGVVQFLTAADTRRLTLGVATQKVTLQFKARTSSSAQIRNVRAAILAWTSLADAPTKDPVSAWNAEGADPTWVANYTSEGSSGDLAVTQDAFGSHTLTVTLATGATTNNLAIVIWCDDADAGANDLLYISDVQLEPGDTAQTFHFRTVGRELDLCDRFMFSTFDRFTVPTIPGALADSATKVTWTADASGDFLHTIAYPTRLWRAGTGTTTIINPRGGAANNGANETGNSDVPITVGVKESGAFFVPSGAAQAADADDIISVMFIHETELGV